MTDSLKHNAATSQPATAAPAASAARHTTDAPHAAADDRPPTDTATLQTTDRRSAGDTLSVGILPQNMRAIETSPLFTLGPVANDSTAWRDVPETAVFGPESVLITRQEQHFTQQQPLTNNEVFQGFILLLAAIYAVLLYRNLNDIMVLFKRVSHDRRIDERLIEDPGGTGFVQFLNLCSGIGILFAGVITVKYAETMIFEQISELLPHGAVIALSLLAAVVFLGLILLQMALLRFVGVVTLSQSFIAQLSQLKRTCFALGVIVIVPFILLFALCPQGTGNLWFYVIVTELTLLVIFYLQKTLSLFISKKVSGLHWILYLCIVEIFPISFLWFLAVR